MANELKFAKPTKNTAAPHQVKVYSVWELSEKEFFKKVVEVDIKNDTYASVDYYIDAKAGNTVFDGFLDYIHLENVDVFNPPANHKIYVRSYEKNPQGNWVKVDEKSMDTAQIPPGE